MNIRKLCIVHCEPKVRRQRMWAAISVSKDVAAIKPSATEVTLACVSWGKSGWRKQDTGPRQLRCISKEWFQWDQSLIPSHSKKSTKFINLRYLFFPLINSNLLIIWLSTQSLLQKLLYCKSHTYEQVSLRYPTNPISYIALQCNRFIILFAQIIHEKQANRKK